MSNLNAAGWITPGNAEVVTAWATVCGALVALGAAVAAIAQLGQVVRDSRDRTRPYVHLDVVPGLHGIGSWDLTIENHGLSTALDVVIDGGDFEQVDEDDYITPHLGEYLLRPKTLVPGARRRIMWSYSTLEPPVRAGIDGPRTITGSSQSRV